MRGKARVDEPVAVAHHFEVADEREGCEPPAMRVGYAMGLAFDLAVAVADDAV